jgi:uncharacterized protein (TIGR01440 family)
MMANDYNIEQELKEILNKFTQAINLTPNSILVIGCSTSEVTGGTIGKSSSYSTGELIVQTFIDKFAPLNINLAFQCCEHLNRALVVEHSLALSERLDIVSAVPYEKAGGSTAAAAYKLFKSPVLAEYIKADVGIDIGGTFIGMHLKHVAVPVRLDGIKKLGDADIKFAHTRPKYIGGERAKYK